MVTGGEIGMLVDGSVNLDPDCPLNPLEPDDTVVSFC